MKIPIGIFFGGATPIRDHSYQTAQRLMDLLKGDEFEPIPILVDPFGQLILLNKLPSGESISEFYPAEEKRGSSQESPFAFYPEQLGELGVLERMKLARGTGRLISTSDLPELISIAFLTLPDAAALQQSLHVLEIPHTGESAEVAELCADRYKLRLRLQQSGLNMPSALSLTAQDWQDNNIQAIWGEDSVSVAYPLLLRPANQYTAGRSSVVEAKDGPEGLRRAIDLAFGQKRLALDDLLDMSPVDRENLVQHLALWSSGIGFPLELHQGKGKKLFSDPASLLDYLNQLPADDNGQLLFKSLNATDKILVSSLPEGTAISCVLLKNEQQQWNPAELQVLGNATQIVAGENQETPSRKPKIAESMVEQIAASCKGVAEEINGKAGLRIFGVLDGSGNFRPEEVQGFAGPNRAEGIDAGQVKQFIVASLRAGQEHDPDPVYRSLLELITTASNTSATEDEQNVPPAVTDHEREFIEEPGVVSAVEPETASELPSNTPLATEENVEEPLEAHATDQALYKRELEKLNREKEVTPNTTTDQKVYPGSAKEGGNLWTNMKLFFGSRLFWKNVGAIAAFLLLLFLTLNMGLRMYTRHGDSMQLEDYRGLLLEEAERKAAGKDLKIRVQNSVFVLGKRPGEIATQYPTPLSKVKEDRTVFVTIYKEEGGDVVLPSFTTAGDYLQSYRDALGNRKVTLLVKKREFRSKLEEGTIIYLLVNGEKITNTELERGNVKVSEGSTVEAVISTRISSTVETPKLICDTYDEAVFHLQAKELVLGKVYGGSDGNRASYYVWKQDPSYGPGKLIPKGTQVDIYLIPTRPDGCE